MAEKMPDAEEIKEIMQVMSTEIPKLLVSISDTMYKTENAEKFGKSIAIFYKQMRDAGMSEKQAFEMTEQYMNNFSLGGMISNALGGKKISVHTDDACD